MRSRAFVKRAFQPGVLMERRANLSPDSAENDWERVAAKPGWEGA